MGIVAPLCPQKAVWPSLTQEVHKVLTQVIEKYDVDPTRLYLSGMSLGAFGCWSLVTAYPNLFAAVVAVCGGYAQPRKTSLRALLRSAHSPPNVAPQDAVGLRNVPAWLFHGSEDNIVVA